MRKLSLLLAILMLSAIIGCHSDSGTEPDAGIRQPSSAEKSLVASANNFGHDIFSRLAISRPDSNLFISPLSISMALGMAYNGAAGTTAEEMKSVLGYADMSTETINQSYRYLLDVLKNLDERVLVEIANSSWARQDFILKPEFVDVLKTSFDAEARSLDFSRPESVDIINDWIADKTHDKIEDMLDGIDPNTVLFLINALYFKAPWTVEFDPEKTTDGFFQLEDGTDITCPLMHMRENFMWGQNEQVRILDLPYGDGEYSMTLIQPKTGVAMADVLAALNADTFENWLGLLAETELDLVMPRFKVEDYWLLNDVLKAMGMPTAFGGGANFTGINAERDIFISRVIHRTLIEVDEAGTEAAAVTVIDFRETSAGPEMVLNRPFIYVIRDHHTGAQLFMGLMNNPLEGPHV